MERSAAIKAEERLLFEKGRLLPKPGDLSGAFGDLGTLVPIYLALAAIGGLAPARSLVLVGLVYIAAALYFRVPIPVQPLKAMAAIAIASGVGLPLLRAAAIWMGLIMLVLCATGGIEWLSRFFTQPIVKGVQLGVGLMLLKAGVGFLLSGGHPETVRTLVDTGLFSRSEFLLALWILVIPQLPLTLGNAVFAASDVARGCFGDRAKRVTPKRLAASIGAANLVAGTLGGMPVCHGSGGLTAHVRFGARTAWATIIMGTCCIVLGLAFRQEAPQVLRTIPLWLLGSLICYVGLCHAFLIRGLAKRRSLALAMGAVGLATGNLAIALGFGLLVSFACDRLGRWG